MGVPNNINCRPGWFLPDRLVTPEAAFLNRRRFLRQMGMTSAGLLASTMAGCSRSDSDPELTNTPTNLPAAGSANSPAKYPAPRIAEFNPGWPLTEAKVAAKYNNFYEFTLEKDEVHKLVNRFVISPWPIAIGGLVEKPMALDVQELIEMMGLEERVYRFRCVEAWAMIVPWTGFPLRKLLEKVQPKSEARFVRFETFNRPDQAPGMKERMHSAEDGKVVPWPYFEGLRMDEAMNPLTLVATGLYGKPLPKQHGAPIRIVVPWKYGYKSIKSIVKIDCVAPSPSSFWERIAPREYPFESNVNPNVPHPRWSQATERMIDTGRREKTQIFNGYGQYVAQLYSAK